MKPDLNLNTCTRIKMIREQRNYTQTYVANELGIRQNTYSKIENGLISLKLCQLAEIASVLQVPLADILEEGKSLFSLNKARPVDTGSKFGTDKFLQILEEEVKYLRTQNDHLLDILKGRSFTAHVTSTAKLKRSR